MLIYDREGGTEWREDPLTAWSGSYWIFEAGTSGCLLSVQRRMYLGHVAHFKSGRMDSEEERFTFLESGLNTYVRGRWD